MTWDPTAPTKALEAAQKAMDVPRGLMTFANDGRGAPTREQRSLYLGAVSFTYAVWENFVEEISLELVDAMAAGIDPERIPASARTLISSKATAWELAVHPGWRGLWIEQVRAQTVGVEGVSWGLNTASRSNVETIFQTLGIEKSLPDMVEPPLDTSGRPMSTPANVGLSRTGKIKVSAVLDTLIGIRGEAVHTAKTRQRLLKREVQWWAFFIENLVRETDSAARESVAGVLKPQS